MHCNTLQNTATHCNTLQHTATQCNTLHHSATNLNSRWSNLSLHTVTHCNILQRCNILQHTATHLISCWSEVRSKEARSARSDLTKWHIAANLISHCTLLSSTSLLTYSYVSYLDRDSFTGAPCLSHVCTMTHLYVCCDSFVYAPWLISMCAITQLYGYQLDVSSTSLLTYSYESYLDRD